MCLFIGCLHFLHFLLHLFFSAALAALFLPLVTDSLPDSLTDCHFRALEEWITFETWDPSDFGQSEVKTKSEREKRQKDINIVMSGQFCTLAMFYLLCRLHDLQKFLLALALWRRLSEKAKQLVSLLTDSGVSSAEEFLLVLIKLSNENLRTDKICLCISQFNLMC